MNEVWKRHYWKHRDKHRARNKRYHEMNKDRENAKRRVRYQKKKEAELLAIWDKMKAA